MRTLVLHASKHMHRTESSTSLVAAVYSVLYTTITTSTTKQLRTLYRVLYATITTSTSMHKLTNWACVCSTAVLVQARNDADYYRNKAEKLEKQVQELKEDKEVPCERMKNIETALLVRLPAATLSVLLGVCMHHTRNCIALQLATVLHLL
jgi:helix-turn-helix protein